MLNGTSEVNIIRILNILVKPNTRQSSQSFQIFRHANIELVSFYLSEALDVLFRCGTSPHLSQSIRLLTKAKVGSKFDNKWNTCKQENVSLEKSFLTDTSPHLFV